MNILLAEITQMCDVQAACARGDIRLLISRKPPQASCPRPYDSVARLAPGMTLIRQLRATCMVHQVFGGHYR